MRKAEMENPAGGPGHPKEEKLEDSSQYSKDEKTAIRFFKFLSDTMGFSIIPLVGKDPACNGQGWQKWGEQKHPFNPNEYRGKNAGVCCGPASKVLVVDKDDINGFQALAESNEWEVPETFTVTTGAGEHLYYEYPEDGREYGCKSIKHSIFTKHTIFDIKGKGGQVVAPGSTHIITGKTYKIEKDIPIAKAPEWLLQLIHGNLEINLDPLRNIPPSKVSEKIIESMAGVTDATKKLILEAPVVGTRSEKGMSVLKALLGARLSESIIYYIFDYYPIGEKYREKGSAKRNRRSNCRFHHRGSAAPILGFWCMQF